MQVDIFFCPIEKIEARYSSQWWGWFEEGFKKHGKSYFTVGDTKKHEIRCGEFLDVSETNFFKLAQGAHLVKALEKTSPKTVFFADLWNPVVSAIAYMRDGMGLDFKIKGCLHAGTWDEHDFISRVGMGKWAKGFERSLLAAADEVFVATQFHVDLIQEHLGTDYHHKFRIVNWPVSCPKWETPPRKKDLVVFPHRIAPEKAPEEFATIERIFSKKYPEKYPETQWLKTVEECATKPEYYGLLSKAKIVVSTARQETFGIAMAEGAARGCVPVVPNRLSYSDLYPKEYRYDTLEEAADMIYQGLDNYDEKVMDFGFSETIDWIEQI